MTHVYKLLLLGLALLATTVVGCTEDPANEKYRSEPPTLNGITAKSLSNNTETIHVGEKIVLTAQQKNTGRLLGLAKYSWTLDGTAIGSKRQVYFDEDSSNPSDTVTINTAGEYKLTFSGTYNARGNVQAWSAKHGSSITYSFEGDVNSRVVCSVHAGYTPGFDITASTKIKVLP